MCGTTYNHIYAAIPTRKSVAQPTTASMTLPSIKFNGLPELPHQWFHLQPHPWLCLLPHIHRPFMILPTYTDKPSVHLPHLWAYLLSYLHGLLFTYYPYLCPTLYHIYGPSATISMALQVPTTCTTSVIKQPTLTKNNECPVWLLYNFANVEEPSLSKLLNWDLCENRNIADH